MDLLESLDTPAYKIASFEIVDLPLIRYVASTGKPMIMSTGMASEDEIDEAVTTAREAGCNDLVLLHCISSYPAPMNQANLRQKLKPATRFDVLAGFLDRTMSITVSVGSIALGFYPVLTDTTKRVHTAPRMGVYDYQGKIHRGV